MNSILNADLHCHSVVSDGTLTPEALAERASAKGVELWALTDHDEIGGQARAASAKISRKTGAFANSMVAVVLNGESSRAVLGAAGPRATILPHVSAALASGSPLDQMTGLVTRDVADILPEPDSYLQSLHETNVRRALLEVLAP